MEKGRARVQTAIDIATLLALMVAVGFFVRRELSRAVGLPTAPVAGDELVGRAMPVLEALDTAGARAPVDAGRIGAPLLLFLFRSDCPACAAQRAGWIELAAAARRMGARVLALTGEPAGPLASRYLAAVEVETRYSVDPSQLGALDIGMVPTTLVIDASGTIRHATVGVIRDVTPIHEALGALGTTD